MDDLLVKYLLQECSPEEEATVLAWIHQDAANQKRFDGFVWLWNESKRIKDGSTIDVDTAWQQFVLLRNAAANRETPIVRITANRRRWLTVAASAIVLLAAVWMYKLVVPTLPTPPAITMLKWKTTNNTLTDTLPDGSIVTLNKNSSLQFPSSFADGARNISLEGEAFFEVRRDTAHPFIIQTNDVQVRVLGTSFNVRNRAGETKVVVETGLVQVSHKSKQVKLKAGEQAEVRSADSTIQVQPVTNVLYNYYRSNVFVCDDTPLPLLVQALNEAYDSQIEIGNPALEGLRITTTFNNESLDTIINVLSETLGIRHRKKGGLIILE